VTVALTIVCTVATYGLRPAPFLLGAAYIALGLGLSGLAVTETRGHARLEAAQHVPADDGLHQSWDGAGAMAALGRKPDVCEFVQSWIFNSNKVFATFKP